MKSRLLADENTSHHLVSACKRLQSSFPILHLATLGLASVGLSDDDLLDVCLEKRLILVAHDRRTLGGAATRAIRERAGHAGIILYRAFVRQNDYGAQSRYLTEFWHEASRWDWRNRMVYLPTEIPSQNV